MNSLSSIFANVASNSIIPVAPTGERIIFALSTSNPSQNSATGFTSSNTITTAYNSTMYLDSSITLNSGYNSMRFTTTNNTSQTGQVFNMTTSTSTTTNPFVISGATTGMCFSFWLRLDAGATINNSVCADTARGKLIWSTYVNQNGDYGYAIYIKNVDTNNAGIVFEFGQSTSNSSGVSVSSNTFNVPYSTLQGNWCNICINIVPSSPNNYGIVNFYLNGSLSATGSDQIAYSSWNANRYVLWGSVGTGKWPNNITFFCRSSTGTTNSSKDPAVNGNMANFRFYLKQLSAGEILYLYQNKQ